MGLLPSLSARVAQPCAHSGTDHIVSYAHRFGCEVFGTTSSGSALNPNGGIAKNTAVESDFLRSSDLQQFPQFRKPGGTRVLAENCFRYPHGASIILSLRLGHQSHEQYDWINTELSCKRHHLRE